GRPRRASTGVTIRDGVTTGVVAFAVAMCLSLPLRGAVSRFPASVAVPLTLFIVCVGVLFDAIGIAAASADEAAFHAMAAKRIAGARQAILVVRNAGRVMTLCNDIVGDLAGTLGGATAAAAAYGMPAWGRWDPSIAGAAAVALVAGLTIGGKAAAKGVAINRSLEITRLTGYCLYLWEKATGIRVFRDGKGVSARARRRKRT
ncbi:MAG: hypothetical protein NUV93_00555, partial [Firmicutes bacterium]|nr:hypothetical protein [Bacillota bacterium]